MARDRQRASRHRLYARDGKRSPSELMRKLFGDKGRDTCDSRRAARVMTVSAGEICQFLGCLGEEVYFRRAWARDENAGDVAGFDEFLAKDCEVLAHFGRSRATYRFLCRGPDNDATVIDGLLFVRHQGTRLVVGIGPLDPTYYGDTTSVFDLLAADRDKAIVDGIFDRFFSDKALKAKVHKVGRDGGVKRVDLGASVALDDVVLPQAAKDALVANTLGLLQKRELYRKNGIALKRGIILEGSPGNGKTLVCKALAGTGLFTVFWVTPAEYTSLFEMFQRAVRQAPSLVLLEDIDLLGASRETVPKALGDLLNILDGVVEADGVITIATTNRAEVLDQALAQRPNRFDLRIRFDNPGLSQRLAMLRKFTAKQGQEGEVRWQEWATQTAGMSAAQVREVCYLAVKMAIEAGRLDGEGKAVLVDDDLAQAIAQAKDCLGSRRKLGFLAEDLERKSQGA